MTQFFDFESDFVDSLRCIPMQVRFKLDTCGVKLQLHQWNKFNADDRQFLVDAPCTTGTEINAYRKKLYDLVELRTGETATDLAIDPHPAWNNPKTIPESVEQKSKEIGATLEVTQWETLTLLQRFALIKLSRSSHENKNFLPAMKEFQLL